MKKTNTKPAASTVADACAIEVTSIELHLGSDADLPKRYGRKIKAMGGHYGEARGNATDRIVHVPATDEGLALGDELRDQFGPWNSSGQRRRARCVVIFRGPKTRQMMAHQHVFCPGEGWVSTTSDLADMLRAWDQKIRATIADPNAHCHSFAVAAQRDPQPVDAVNPALADEADEVAAMCDAEAAAANHDPAKPAQTPDAVLATVLLTSVLTSLKAKLDASEAVIDELTIGMELDSIDEQAHWFAKCQVRGRRLRSGRQEWSPAYGSGATIDEAVTALGDDVDDWVAMFKVDAKLAKARRR